jgi:hypothetical protein
MFSQSVGTDRGILATALAYDIKTQMQFGWF